MKILHVTGFSITHLTPSRIACYWGRYLPPNEGRVAIMNRHGGPNHFVDIINPYGILCAAKHRKQFYKLFEWADVIHFHDDIYVTSIPDDITQDKICVYHAHIGDIPERFFSGKTRRFKYNKRVGHAGLTNGYGRLFDEEEKSKKCPIKWHRLPDILDIYHPIMRARPETRQRRLRVNFTWSNVKEAGSKINAKCPRATRAILKSIKGISKSFVNKAAFSVCMGEKQRSHIVVDDLYSPYVHLAAFEGACVECCVFTKFDDYTKNDICKFVGAPPESFPFLHATDKTIIGQLEYYRTHIKEAIDIGRYSRNWMDKYYQPTKLLERYLDFYQLVKEGRHNETP